MSPERRPGVAQIWDVAIRAFHWPLVVLIPFAWWSAEFDHLDWHRLAGYAILGLILFRLIWGVVGSQTARFAVFIRGPRAVAAYLRGEVGAPVGHNPLGALSVAAMLLAIALQVTLGLFAIDEDAIEGGPLSGMVSFDTARLAAGVHHKLFWVIAGLAALHVAAILVYRLRGKNLVAPMITGAAQLEPGQEPPIMAPLWRAILVALLAGALSWFIAHGLKLS